MQACIYEQYGPPDVVTIREVAKPTPRAGEVLVRVRASSVTTADWRFRTSTFPGIFWLPGRLMLGLLRPRNGILGMDFSGVVESVGEGVTRFRAGDAIFGATSFPRLGAHAEYLVVPANGAVIPKPAFLTDAQAAAIPFGGNSALAFLRDFGALTRGQRVLVIGASGGVGVWAVQIARHLGAEVTAVCSARNHELVRSLGAHHVADYADAAVPPGEYDLIFDPIGATTFDGCKSSLSAKGTYLPLNNGLRGIVRSLFTRRIKIAISANTQAGLEEIVALIEKGALKPVVDRVYPMAEIAAAHRHVEGRHKRGSVIVAMV